MECRASYCYQHTDTGRWYARVRLPDGQEVEFKFHEHPSEAEIAATAERYWTAITEAAELPEPTLVVEAEDGAII